MREKSALFLSHTTVTFIMMSVSPSTIMEDRGAMWIQMTYHKNDGEIVFWVSIVVYIYT